jgi:superkiller protein 3
VLAEAARLLDSGNHAQALALLEPLVQQLQSVAAYHSLLGAAYAGAGQVIPAVQSLQTAFHLEPGNENYCLDLARVLGENGAYQGSVKLLEWAVKTKPRSARLHVGLALALIAGGRMQEARAAASRALELDPKLETGYTTMAMVLEDGRVWAEMLRIAQKLKGVNPQNHLAFYYEGLALASLGEGTGSAQRAESALRRSLELDPRLVLARVQLAKLLLAGRQQEAIAQLEQAISLDPDFADAHFLLGRALAKAGDTERSAKHLEIHRRLVMAQAQEKPRLEVSVNLPNP